MPKVNSHMANVLSHWIMFRTDNAILEDKVPKQKGTNADTMEGNVDELSRNSIYSPHDNCMEEASRASPTIRGELSAQEHDPQPTMGYFTTVGHSLEQQGKDQQCQKAITTTVHPRSLPQYDCNFILVCQLPVDGAWKRLLWLFYGNR